jgi:hypothetical protein
MSNDSLAVKELRLVMQQVSDLEPAMVSTEPLEPYLTNLVRIVEEHPGELNQIKVEFVRLVRDLPPGATEMLEFVMHKYRWDEVRSEILGRLNSTNNLRLKSVLLRVMEAFDRDWPDRDVYATYRDEWPRS